MSPGTRSIAADEDNFPSRIRLQFAGIKFCGLIFKISYEKGIKKSSTLCVLVVLDIRIEKCYADEDCSDIAIFRICNWIDNQENPLKLRKQLSYHVSSPQISKRRLKVCTTFLRYATIGCTNIKRNNPTFCSWRELIRSINSKTFLLFFHGYSRRPSWFLIIKASFEP
jgi:hypothetical protein